MTEVREFIRHHYRHFNARTLREAAQAWEDHLAGGGKMLLSMAGAMSTAELGVCLAELIRQNKVHALCVTGANLEEDAFNLIANAQYQPLPNYRELSPQDELSLLEQGLNRVTDTCIPESAMRKLENLLLEHWQAAARNGERHLPQHFFYQVLRSGSLAGDYQIDPKHSWLLAAAEANLPLWVPGWEDSSTGNMFAGQCLIGKLPPHIVKSGVEQMMDLAQWYRGAQQRASIGFFQIGGGIAGDFPICVVPMLNQDLKENVRTWGYFGQISDSTTSYGSYSGASASEKITWGKITVDTPRFIIESDATICFPLIAAYLLGT